MGSYRSIRSVVGPLSRERLARALSTTGLFVLPAAAFGQTLGQPSTPSVPQTPGSTTPAGLRPVDPTYEDTGPLGVSLRQLRPDLRTPLDFDRVYQIQPAHPNGPDQFTRISGAIAAVFPRSQYTTTRNGVRIDVPAGTVFYIGGPPVPAASSLPPTHRPSEATSLADNRVAESEVRGDNQAAGTALSNRAADQNLPAARPADRPLQAEPPREPGAQADLADRAPNPQSGIAADPTNPRQTGTRARTSPPTPPLLDPRRRARGNSFFENTQYRNQRLRELMQSAAEARSESADRPATSPDSSNSPDSR